jgi:hypothetical protein
MNETREANQYDDWLKDDSDAAALVMRQWLIPVEEAAFGADERKERAVVFPPTYPIAEEASGYNISRRLQRVSD